MTRGMSAEEADDHWSEFGRETPVEVWNRERDEREDRAAAKQKEDGDA